MSILASYFLEQFIWCPYPNFCKTVLNKQLIYLHYQVQLNLLCIYTDQFTLTLCCRLTKEMLFRGALNPRILSRMAPSHHIPKPCAVTEFRPVETGGRIELIIGNIQSFFHFLLSIKDPCLPVKRQN